MKANILTSALSLVAVLCVAQYSQAVTVADLRGDFTPGASAGDSASGFSSVGGVWEYQATVGFGNDVGGSVLQWDTGNVPTAANYEHPSLNHTDGAGCCSFPRVGLNTFAVLGATQLGAHPSDAANGPTAEDVVLFRWTGSGTTGLVTVSGGVQRPGGGGGGGISFLVQHKSGATYTTLGQIDILENDTSINNYSYDTAFAPGDEILFYIDNGADNEHFSDETFLSATIDGTLSAVPEPSSFALAALGLVGLGWFRLRRR